MTNQDWIVPSKLAVAALLRVLGLQSVQAADVELLYAVWEFCERELGVRFLAWEYTHLPDHGGKLTLGEKEVRHCSPLPRLRENYYKANWGDPLFPSRLRLHARG